MTVGDYDLSTSAESDSRTEWVNDAYIHNQYNQPSLHNNDIGVLVIKDEMDEGIGVAPVCLPSAREHNASNTLNIFQFALVHFDLSICPELLKDSLRVATNIFVFS